MLGNSFKFVESSSLNDVFHNDRRKKESRELFSNLKTFLRN